MNWDLDFGELAGDKDFVGKCEDLKKNLMQLEENIDQALIIKKHYDQLSREEQIELDLYLVFALNSLYWIHLRIQGVDPNKHPIKNEILRIKKTMLRWQEIKDKDKRPTVDKDAAKRFVRSGLYDPKAVGPPVNKKIKFGDNDN